MRSAPLSRACGAVSLATHGPCPWPGGLCQQNYSAASVGGFLRGAFAAPGRLAGRALTWCAVPDDGRFALRGRARDVGPPRSARASISTTASSSVTFSGVLSAGNVALTPLWLT